jgi:hypothetical protein
VSNAHWASESLVGGSVSKGNQRVTLLPGCEASGHRPGAREYWTAKIVVPGPTYKVIPNSAYVPEKV